MKRFLVLPLLLCISLAHSQIDSSLVKFINPPSLPAVKGYSHAVSVDLGNSVMLTISGQVALDSTGKLIGPGDLTKQTEQVFSNIEKIISHSGGTMSNLIKLGFYVTDVSEIQQIRAVRDRFINATNPPASTLVQVAQLFRGDLLIEIEATAIIPKPH